jgi:hypothetical protein
LLIAGLVWIIAGANILRIGIITWVDDQREWLFKTGEAIVVFLPFFSLIFRRLYNKHTAKIGQKSDRNCPFSFFDVKGWLIMDYTGDSGTQIAPFTHVIHCGLLHRVIVRADPDRHPVSGSVAENQIIPGDPTAAHEDSPIAVSLPRGDILTLKFSNYGKFICCFDRKLETSR